MDWFFVCLGVFLFVLCVCVDLILATIGLFVFSWLENTNESLMIGAAMLRPVGAREREIWKSKEFITLKFSVPSQPPLLSFVKHGSRKTYQEQLQMCLALFQTSSTSKKRSKSKKPTTSSKKAKTEEKSPSPAPASQPAAGAGSTARSKKSSNKRAKPDKDTSKHKDKVRPPFCAFCYSYRITCLCTLLEHVVNHLFTKCQSYTLEWLWDCMYL